MINGNRQLLYVEAYTKIEALIKEKLKPGDKLPSENELAQKMGISRGSLRQALLLLREDGMIYKHQGKGNFVANYKKEQKLGLEQIKLPIHESANVEYDETKLEVQYTPCSSKMQEFLEIDSSVLLMNFYVSYKVKGEVVAVVIYFLPYQTAMEYELDLENKEQLLDFINNYVATNIKSSKCSFNITSARTSIAEMMNLTEDTTLIYFGEKMMDALGKVQMYVKTYCDPNYFNFTFYRY